MTDWLMIDLKILLALGLWIMAVFGFGALVYRIYGRVFGVQVFAHTLWLELFVSLILGVAFLSFIVQVLNFFLPLYAFLSLGFLLIGLGLFVWLYREILRSWQIGLSGLCAFFIVGILSLHHDSYGDSVNYHIQIVTWIEQSPIIFGLGNVHGRLGFNGIIYNFYALSDVSQIFPGLRSFIGNEIVYFGLFFSVFLILLNPLHKHARQDSLLSDKSALFVVCAALAFPFILRWGEFRGLYCEGIGAVLGILVFAMLLHALNARDSISQNPTESKHDKPALLAHTLVLSFVIAFFAALVKIANTGLLAAVAICALYLYKKQIVSKISLKYLAYLGIFALIYALPWALKGYMTSGMIAYPAAVGYIPSLPWAVSDEQRAGEVCWVMSWARDPGINCKEVLSSSAWLKKWLLMETRYFNWYFKYFVYGYWAALGLSVLLLILPKSLYTRKQYKDFLLLFIGALCGVAFWFASGPDPRFGMVYLIPLLGILYAHNLTLIQNLQSKILRILGFGSFLATLTPIYLLIKTFVIWVWGVWIVLCNVRLRVFIGAMILLSLWGSYNIFGASVLKSVQDSQKIKPIFVQKRLTDFGAEIYVRKDGQAEGFESVEYEPLPTTPYWNPKIELKSIMGRKAYINTGKENQK